jgi:hypothetical protein
MVQIVSSPGTLNSYSSTNDPVWTIYSNVSPVINNSQNLPITSSTGGSSSSSNATSLPYPGPALFSDSQLASVELACLNNPNCVAISFGGNVNILSGQVTNNITSHGSEYMFVLKNTRQQICSSANSSLQPPYSTFCSTWCSQKPNAGLCDNFMVPYCSTATGLIDPNCNCINSVINYYPVGNDITSVNYIPTSQYNPLCFDQTCIDQGYISTSMLNGLLQGCPELSCFDISNLLGGTTYNDKIIPGVNIPNNIVLNSCSGTNIVGITIPTTQQIIPDKTSTPNTLFTSTNMIIGGIILVGLVGLIIYLLV